MQAVRCPVCCGSGKIVNPDSEKSTAIIKETCHGCGGKGWVEVNDSAYPYYPPFPNPIYPIGPYYTMTTTDGPIKKS